MRNGRGQFNMAHALAADLGSNDFHAALFADDAAMLHALVLAAVALVVFDRAENLGAEKTVALGLERAVVDGLGLFHFAVGPFPNGFGRSDGYLDGFQIADVRRIGRRAAHGEEIVQAHIVTLACRKLVRIVVGRKRPGEGLPSPRHGINPAANLLPRGLRA